MQEFIQYSGISNNNRYTYKLYYDQKLIAEYKESESNHSCLGGITGQLSTNCTLNRILVNLYTTTSRDGNNWLIYDEEEIKYYMNYLYSLFPIFTWSLETHKNNSTIKYFKLLFKCPICFNQSDYNQIKMLLNLIRRLYECPRNFQLKHIIELHKQGWHNLSIHQIMLLGELTEYYSTNDHKLISYVPSILLTDQEFVNRVKEISGIFNANRTQKELNNMTSSWTALLPRSPFEQYPTSLTPTLLDFYETLFSITNNIRKKLKLNEL